MTKRYTKRELLAEASLTGVGVLLTSCSPAPKHGGSTRAALKTVLSPQTPNKITASRGAPAGSSAVPNPDNVTLLTSGSTQYDQLRQGFNTRIRKDPRVIALCKNLNGVAETVGYAAANKLSVAIKSGGHSFEGFSCNDDGLVINLSLLNSVEWLDDNTVRLGPSVTLSHLYDNILPKQRIIPAGSCGGVGIGGLTLGGGYGFFSRKYGLTCDSLVDLTLVDGKGVIHKGSADTELLWACRGGGNGSLGVVTEMVFKTHPAPEFFHSYRFRAGHLDAKQAASKLEKWFELAPSLPPSCLSAFVLNGSSLVILVTDFESPTTELQSLLSKLGGLAKSSSTGKPQNLASALKVYYGRPAPLNFRNCSGGLFKSFEDIRGCITQVLDLVVNHPGLMYQVDTLGGNIASAEFEAASCYPYRDRRFVSELQSYWTTPGQATALSASFQEMQNLLLENGVTAHYANYPSLEFADWQHAYYGDNYARLQVVKRKYDPADVFRYEQSVRL